MNQILDDIIDDICLTEDDFKLKQETIRGVNYKCFDSKISNLNDYFKLSLKYPDNDMLVFDNERYTFQSCYDLSSAFANALIERFKIKKGDRIAIASRNYPEWINSFIAITSIGAIAVPLNSWWTKDELKYGIENCGAKIIIVDDKRYDLIETFADTDNLSLIS
ncbi:MAG: AMP-binding protein, partial [Alphaproteobacteria bacterium]|nr:AMP-binding protein [Alphaproteobacteria bacterium]